MYYSSGKIQFGVAIGKLDINAFEETDPARFHQTPQNVPIFDLCFC